MLIGGMARHQTQLLQFVALEDREFRPAFCNCAASCRQILHKDAFAQTSGRKMQSRTSLRRYRASPRLLVDVTKSCASSWRDRFGHGNAIPSARCCRARANSGSTCSYSTIAAAQITPPKPHRCLTVRFTFSGMSRLRPYWLRVLIGSNESRFSVARQYLASAVEIDQVKSTQTRAVPAFEWTSIAKLGYEKCSCNTLPLPDSSPHAEQLRACAFAG